MADTQTIDGGGVAVAAPAAVHEAVNEAAAIAKGAKNPPVAGVSFVSGLVGLLVANLVLGPLAMILGIVALRRDPSRRTRAVTGIVLGAADIAVFFALAAMNGHGALHWHFLSN